MEVDRDAAIRNLDQFMDPKEEPSIDDIWQDESTMEELSAIEAKDELLEDHVTG
jgi:uncharacterized Zn finger protein